MTIWNRLKQEYKDTALFFRERLLRIFLILSLIFIGVGTASYFLFLSSPDTVNQMMQELAKSFQDKGLIDEGGISFWFLLGNNLWASAICILMGFLPFLFLPVLPLASNAAILGLSAAYSSISGMGLAVFAVGILPHGILELPALILAISLGFYLCKEMVKQILGRADSFLKTLCNVARTFTLLVIPMMFAAALIETYITPVLINACAGALG
ncbi:stage II sporulation protein M [Clostridium sp. D33t1_170424_F3]|uniref:stage II sporulation protein M n=1 Tax=Clostridium sp. D33t1_170424_F3 TaxID=2787099 RepID=UPI0018A8A606|nr:stage II sporulation protein M [Clostridium sp. D33t1_170424_F3]